MVGIVMPQGQISGAERVLLALLEEADPERVVVFAPANSPLATEVSRLGFRVRDFYVPQLDDSDSVLQYMKNLIRATRALRRGVRAEKLTLIHAFLSLTLKVVVPVARIEKVPVIVSVFDITSRESIGRVRSTVQRVLAASTAERILAASEYVAQTLRDIGYPDGKICVVHSGIDPGRAIASRDRSVLNISDDALVFAVVARMTPWKGPDVALEAFVRVRSTLANHNPHLLFAGGPFESGDDAFYDALKVRVRELGLTDVVQFLGHRDDPWPIYSAADVILVPSTKPDPFPTVVLEAGLAARPVVVTALGGGREAVLDGTTGIVASPTPEGFADAMIAAADQGWRTLAGAAAASHIRSAFDRHSYVQRTLVEWSEYL
jgi:glycosyltransferase involved in cell wall biosynthesis